MQKLLVFLMVFLFIETSNHCIFEELFSLLSSIIGSTELLDISCIDHGDKASSDTHEHHEHGETHNILALDNLKSRSDFHKIFILVPLIFISKFLLSVYSYDTLQAKVFSIDKAFPFEFFEQFITSLTLASQAPPALV